MRLFKFQIGVAAFLACLSGTLPAAGFPVTPPADRPFDLTGVWALDIGGGWADAPPLTPAAAKLKEEQIKRNQAGDGGFGDCLPTGMPTILTYSPPLQIVQLPNQLLILHEYKHSPRWIWLDGREHPDPEDVGTTYNGHSVGWWEGDTLVIDTVNINNKVPMPVNVRRKEPEARLLHSEKLHIVERIRMAPDKKSYTNTLTMTDPLVLAQPFTTTLNIKRRNDLELAEYVCENNCDVSGNLRP
ncbi:MAG: hypothetical protein QM696_10895 [Steroidobacteraceae bacterium]